MRKTTLLLIAMFIASTGIAQNKFVKRASVAESAITAKVKKMKAKRNKLSSIAVREAELNTAASALMMPRQEEEWLWEDEWIKGGDYFYSHDKRGNIIENTYDDGFAATKTVYAFDENNNVVSSLETYSEEGEPYENSAKRLISYDEKVKDVIVESQSYIWNEGDWMLYADGHTYKRVITRDEKGNITSVEIKSYIMGDYPTLQKSTITYDDRGLASTWKYEELGYSAAGEMILVEKYTLKDMEWYTTDGQILVMDELDAFMTGGNNRLKKATVYSEGELTGSIEASYQENGDYTYSYIYTTEPLAKEIYTYTVTDANGSYEYGCVAYEDMNADGILNDEDLAYEDNLEVKIDQYGRVVEEVATEDEEMIFAAKYDYVYSSEYGSYPVEQVYSEYDFEASDYVPFLKVVAKDFYDVSAIEDVNADNTSATMIYNIQGVQINVSEQDLPSGIYILKKNGKTYKVAK